ncbi:MAG: hypothetical protein ACSHYF_05060 [Verrucomicrobiaceae bacterium]
MAGERDIAQDPLILQRWLFLADKIESDPSLLAIATDNISRWRKSDRLGSFWALDIWEDLIMSASQSPDQLRDLLQLIRSDDDRSRQLKSCSPFPGILSTTELDRFTCASVL